ncbi:hypothetical protein DDE83_008694 [Stemphylium lycopersici]|uniref:Uncharacterized protein n=1 Tax=Stemphylium lycopersici TaxID=183478 RepID=A0A364MSN5_STELY|nr:hypothetical protein DDE83_008694 [Stemphylium lycopersici]
MSDAFTVKRDRLGNVNITGDTMRFYRFHPLAHLLPWAYYDTSRCNLPLRLTIALTTKHNSTMLAIKMLNDALPAAPPGISPEVQSKINALFGETGSCDASMLLLDAQTGLPNTGGREDLADSRGEEEFLLNKNDDNKHNEPRLSEDKPSPRPQTAMSVKKRENTEAKRPRKRRTRGITSISPRPKFIAHYAYPSESRASLPSSPTPPEPRSAPTSTPETPSPLSYFPEARNYFSMIAEAVFYVSRHITPYLPVPFPFRLPFLSSEPAIISYSDANIELKTRVHAGAQKSSFLCETAHEKVIRVIAFMASSEDDKNECADLRHELVKPLEIKARPKRLRQILKEEGRYVAEDFYTQKSHPSLLGIMPEISTPQAANIITRSKDALGGIEGYVCAHNTITAVPAKPSQKQGVEYTALHQALLVAQQRNTSFGTLCRGHTKHRIQNWLNHVEPQRSLPFGKFPHTRSLTGSLAKKEMRTYVQSSLVQRNFKLEWSELRGGCYIETHPSKMLYGTIPTAMQTTNVSQAWLASRGYRGGAGSPTSSPISEGQGEDGNQQTEPEDEEVAQTGYGIHDSYTSVPENDTYASRQGPELIRSDSMLAADELNRLTPCMDICENTMLKVPITTVKRAKLLEESDPSGSNVPWKMKAAIKQQAEEERLRQAARDMIAHHLAAVEREKTRLQALQLMAAISLLTVCLLFVKVTVMLSEGRWHELMGVFSHSPAMAEYGYVATHHLRHIDFCELERQYRLLRDLPDGRFVTPEIKRRMFHMGEIASEALARLRTFVLAPVKPNAFLRAMRDAPNLIDDEHWERIREE